MQKRFITKIVAIFATATVIISCIPTISYAACNHVWEEWWVVEEATCSEDGEMVRYCDECFERQSKVIPATGVHKWTEWKADGYLCEDGKWERYCTECYKEETKARQGDGSHLWSTWEVYENADCLNKGQERRYCYNCYQYEYKDIPADNTKHDWSNWSTLWDESIEPTIFKSGKQTRHCYTCSKVEEKIIPKLKATVKLSCKSKTLKKGKSFVLKLKTWSYGDKVVSYNTSNKNIATVTSKGKVTAKKKGTATITVKMKSGCKATCKVNVK